MKNQPYHVIDFSASACLFEIRVNDYPVIHMNVEGQGQHYSHQLCDPGEWYPDGFRNHFTQYRGPAAAC